MKNEVCHSFVVEIFTKSLHRGGVICLLKSLEQVNKHSIIIVSSCKTPKTLQWFVPSSCFGFIKLRSFAVEIQKCWSANALFGFYVLVRAKIFFWNQIFFFNFVFQASIFLSTSWGGTSFYRLENKPRSSKII